jgi:hypothetical protein
MTCHICEPFEKVTVTWQIEDGSIAAVLHPIGDGEVRLHIHPGFRTPGLEDEAFAFAEEHYFELTDDERRFLLVPVFESDTLRQKVLSNRGLKKYLDGDITIGEIWTVHYLPEYRQLATRYDQWDC